jgi:hypothetical protein
MSLIVGVAAFAIDVAQWQVAHHKAQVTADATALAAANCLSSTQCTQITQNGDAMTAGQTVANKNGYTNSSLTFAFTSSTVKVTVNTSQSSSFARLFGILSTNISTSATASYSTGSGEKWPCDGGTDCYSLVAGNPCPSSDPNISSSNFVGLDFMSNGGGNSDVENAFSNGVVYSNANANDTHNVTVPGTPSNAPAACASHDSYDSKNVQLNYTTAPSAYPVVWTKPTCTHTSAAYLTTSTSGVPAADQISAPGVYCVTSSPAPSCADDGSNMTAGYIYVDESKLQSGGYEFVGPCVSLTGTAHTGATNITGQPLVYGTSNITTAATSTSWPTCTADTEPTSTYLDDNNSLISAPIFDQCGTFEVRDNNATLTGFVEAWNIGVDKNNFQVQGTGPTSVTNPDPTPEPGDDTLTG